MRKKSYKPSFETDFFLSIFRIQVLFSTQAGSLFAEEKNLNLSFSQFLVLSYIYYSGDDYTISQSDIAKSLSISPPAVSRHIDNLMLLGYVSCHINPESKRKHIVEISKKGLRVFESGRKILGASSRKMLANMSTSRRKMILASLNTLVEELSK